MAVKLRPAVHAGVALEGIVRRVLDGVALCTVATVNADGTAHVNNAFFCVDGDCVCSFCPGRRRDTART